MVQSVDPRIVDCQRKIKNNNYQINECRKKISELQSDIDELRSIRVKYVNLQNELDRAVSNSESKINGIAGFVFNAFAVIKSTFFSPLMDAIKGPGKSNAKNSLDSSIQKIDNQIDKYQNEIESLRNDITSLEISNSTLNSKIIYYRNHPMPTI